MSAKDHKPRRIGLVIASMGAGGAERVMSHLATRWASTPNTEVHLFTFEPPGRASFYPLDPRVQHHRLDLEELSAGPLLDNLERLHTLREAIIETAPDVLLSFIEVNNILTLLASQGLSIPVIISERVHPDYHDVGFWDLLRALSYPGCDRLIVQTEEIREIWSRRSSARLGVIPNPVLEPADEPPTDPMPRPDKLLVAAGRLRPQKGFDLLIEAFGRQARRFPDWTLWIFGEGPEREALQAQIARRGLDDRIILRGRSAQLGWEMRRADLFALSSRFEGFPNVLLEAMACGLPCIAYRCPSGPEDIIEHGQDGILLPREDVDALSDALAALMGDPGRRQALASQADQVLERYALERVMAMWDAVLEEAVG